MLRSLRLSFRQGCLSSWRVPSSEVPVSPGCPFLRGAPCIAAVVDAEPPAAFDELGVDVGWAVAPRRQITSSRTASTERIGEGRHARQSATLCRCALTRCTTPSRRANDLLRRTPRARRRRGCRRARASAPCRRPGSRASERAVQAVALASEASTPWPTTPAMPCWCSKLSSTEPVAGVELVVEAARHPLLAVRRRPRAAAETVVRRSLAVGHDPNVDGAAVAAP